MMLRAAVIAMLLVAVSARAAPPPAGSEDDQLLSSFGSWFASQSGILGSCCGIADGRIVHVEIRDGHYWVKFLHPESIESPPRPKEGQYYEVEPEAVLKGFNPTGYPIAWWAASGRYILHTGSQEPILTHIMCFQPTDSY